MGSESGLRQRIMFALSFVIIPVSFMLIRLNEPTHSKWAFVLAFFSYFYINGLIEIQKSYTRTMRVKENV
jgi:hypothetical protein